MKARLAALVLTLGAVAPACAVDGLAFIEDRRVEIVSPGYREIVDLPVTIDWDITNEGTGTELGAGTAFGVYVDIDPQPPGEDLDYFGRNDPTCRADEGCPDEKYLRQRGIYTTTGTEISFPNLPIAPGVDIDRGDPDFHDITIVLLDTDGRRIGESAWATIFEVRRGGD